MKSSILHGRTLLNLDTEESNELYIGCAGGGGWEFTRSKGTDPVPANSEIWTVELKGLAGGHSGIQIHQQLGNAIKLLGLFLQRVDGLQLVSFDAGVAHNVIPREGSVVFSCPAGNEKALLEALDSIRSQSLSYLPEADQGLEMLLQPAEAVRVFSPSATSRMIAALTRLNIAVFAPIPRPRETTATTVNIGLRAKRRSEYRTFMTNASTNPSHLP